MIGKKVLTVMMVSKMRHKKDEESDSENDDVNPGPDNPSERLLCAAQHSHVQSCYHPALAWS